MSDKEKDAAYKKQMKNFIKELSKMANSMGDFIECEGVVDQFNYREYSVITNAFFIIRDKCKLLHKLNKG